MSIFQDNTKTLPKSDPRIIRVPMDKDEMSARKSSMPTSVKNDNNIRHVKE
jgi:hypothetical protein